MVLVWCNIVISELTILSDGVVTAGNASGICDGAGVLILASEAACAKHDLTPLARVAGRDLALYTNFTSLKS